MFIGSNHFSRFSMELSYLSSYLWWIYKSYGNIRDRVGHMGQIKNGKCIIFVHHFCWGLITPKNTQNTHMLSNTNTYVFSCSQARGIDAFWRFSLLALKYAMNPLFFWEWKKQFLSEFTHQKWGNLSIYTELHARIFISDGNTKVMKISEYYTRFWCQKRTDVNRVNGWIRPGRKLVKL